MKALQVVSFFFGLLVGGNAFAAQPKSVVELENAIHEFIAEVSRPLMGPDQISVSVRIDLPEQKRSTDAPKKRGKVIEIHLGSLDVTADYVVPEKRKVATVSRDLPKKSTFMDRVKAIHVVLTLAPEVSAESVRVLKKAIQKGWPWERHPVALEVMHHPFMESPTEEKPNGSGAVVVKPINRIEVAAPTSTQAQSIPWIAFGLLVISGSIVFAGFQLGKVRLKAEVILPSGSTATAPQEPPVEESAVEAKPVVDRAVPTAMTSAGEETTLIQDVSRLESEQYEVIDLETASAKSSSSQGRPEEELRGRQTPTDWTSLPQELLKLAFQDLDSEEKKILICTRPMADWQLWVDRLTDVDSKLRSHLKIETDILMAHPEKIQEWQSQKARVESRFVESCLRISAHRPDLRWSGPGGRNAKVS